jgi:glycosyltransferase involved in cell wall biosynthesis
MFESRAMNVLINASNLHVGGAVQVATSIISELAEICGASVNIHVLASSVVDRNLRSGGAKISALRGYKVYDSWGLRALWRTPRGILDGYDAVFTIFGPLYRLRQPRNSVVGFAQPWIIYPENEVAWQLGRLERNLLRFKYWIQSLFFSRADLLVVELEHVRDGLVRRKIAKSDRVRIVRNALSSLYADKANWLPVAIPHVAADLKLGFVGRNYFHKNTKIFPDVHRILKERHGIDARFFVTFDLREWEQCELEFRACSVNVGTLAVAQCPSFYEAMDAVVFPSLLECFSAAPLEAMAMERPLFASDRPFIRDVCGPHAHYFDPMDAESAALSIAGWFKDASQNRELLKAARQHAMSFSSAKERAHECLCCIAEIAKDAPSCAVAP